MAEIVYVLCTITSIICLVLLIRQYVRTPNRLLFWTGICFAALAVNNVLLFVDLVLFPGTAIDLSMWRTCSALVGLTALVYGFILEEL